MELPDTAGLSYGTAGFTAVQAVSRKEIEKKEKNNTADRIMIYEISHLAVSGLTARLPALTTGVCEAGTKMRGASNMNIHYDVTCLLTAVWRSHSGQIVWVA